MSADDLLRTTEAAALLGVKVKTVYRFIEDGELPVVEGRSRVRIRRDDVDQFLERCRVKPGDLTHLIAPRVDA